LCEVQCYGRRLGGRSFLSFEWFRMG
jgi:hypothetical protein